MNLTSLRPCDSCGGPLRCTFQVLRTSVALINAAKANQFLSMTQYFNGNMKLANLFAGEEDCVVVAMDTKAYKTLMVELFLCLDCLCGKDIRLAEIIERRNQQIEKQTKAEKVEA